MHAHSKCETVYVNRLYTLSVDFVVYTSIKGKATAACTS